MSDGCSSGPVVLTLAGPRPFLLVLVLHCPGRVRFFEILAIVPLLSSSLCVCGGGEVTLQNQGDHYKIRVIHKQRHCHKFSNHGSHSMD